MPLAFSKYEGLGNDFVVIDAPWGRELGIAGAQRICDRHRGVGADGVLVVDPSTPSMRVLNADGSEPEMCGNGLRCVALHLVRTGMARLHATFEVQTGAGPHACRVSGESGVEIEMRAATFVPSEVPVRADAPVLDAPFEVDGRVLRISAVGMGNPHAVTFDDVGEARLVLGPRLEGDARFPARVNVGFAAKTGDTALSLRVFERGVGWTEACGTGACAAVAAAVETGRVPRGVPVTVTLPGGPLSIVVGAPGARIRMTGPARHLFDGVLDENLSPRRAS